MVTDLHLVRHGEAVSNVEPVIGGMRGDRGLTDLGRLQAALLEERLRAERLPADVLVTSTLPRALETAAYVARALGLEAHGTDDLHELRPGDEADGLTIEEWRARADRDVPPRDPFVPFSPDGESWAGFLLRAQGALHRLVTEHAGRSVVAVCHGGVLEASFHLAFGTGGTTRRLGIDPLNTSITHWRHDPAAPDATAWTLVTFNDAGHLAGLLTADSPHDAVPRPPTA